MYVPAAFRLMDRDALLAHAAAYPFATVITCHSRDGRPPEPRVSHLPLLVDPRRSCLRGHLARENSQISDLEAGAMALAIFHGPHAYVSPSVYEEHPAVPTWNYVVVHARGAARVVDDEALLHILEDSVAHFDTTGWRMEGDPAFLRGKLAAIAGFEIAIEELEGKWKLSQNRSAADRAHVAAWLEKGDEQSRAIATIMRARG